MADYSFPTHPPSSTSSQTGSSATQFSASTESVTPCNNSNIHQLRPSASPRWDIECPMLELPVEILLLLVDHLSAVDRLVFTLTCRAFYTAVRHCLEQTFPLSKQEYLSYLTIISRYNPAQWVCEFCDKLHATSALDTPRSRCLSTCPVDNRRNGLAGRSIQLRLEHRDIQLALKLERLKDISLDQVMMPYQVNFYTQSVMTGAVQSRYSAYPKIVQGRYLLLSVWAYEQCGPPISKKTIGYLSICHQRLPFKSDLWSHEMVFATDALRFAFLEARLQPRTTVDGSCSECHTDFSVCFSPEKTTISAWHDLGSEGTPLDRAWRDMQAYCRYDNSWPERDYPEGSIRELYKSGSNEERTEPKPSSLHNGSMRNTQISLSSI